MNKQLTPTRTTSMPAFAEKWALRVTGKPRTAPEKPGFASIPSNCKCRYSARKVQFGKKPHSTPPPAVHPLSEPLGAPGKLIVEFNNDVAGHPRPKQVTIAVELTLLHAQPPVPYTSTLLKA